MCTHKATSRHALIAAVALASLVTWVYTPAATAAPKQTPYPQKLGRADVKPTPRIVNGTAITIQQAPWQTYVEATVGPDTFACGGSIFDATHVITAGHCVFDDAGAAIPPAGIMVAAGVSNVATPAPGDAVQTSAVTAVRSHPLYDPVAGAGSPDDVAVLTLATPLVLGSATAQAIALGTGRPAFGSLASTTGFGLQTPGQPPNGQLYGLDMSLESPLACGGPNNALYQCTASAIGSGCQGDSGGPLTQGAALIGITSFGDVNCGVGQVNGFTNATAGEIGAFIAGDDTPPLAPRGGNDVSARGTPEVGGSFTCSPGTWTNSPVFRYTILNSANGEALQFGPSPTYTFGAANVGQTVSCQVSATTAGGKGIALTEPTPPIAPAPPGTESTKPRLAVSIKASKRRVRSGARVSFTIRVSNRGGTTARRVTVCDTPGKGLAYTGKPKGSTPSNGSACWTISFLGAKKTRALRITLRTTRTIRTRTVTNRVTARADNATTRRRASARVVVRGTRSSAPAPGVTG